MSELPLLGLVEVADAIAQGRTTSQAVTEACLARIDAWQPRVNAFIRIEREEALTFARKRDRELAKGRSRGRLHGVPLAHKDLFYRKDRISTAGSKLRRDWVAPGTATALERLDAAGAIDLGGLNMAEFAAGPTGHNVHYGDCRNPWNPAHITGGSSSGSGAATAARLVFGSLGSDTGGSIRMPAAACGVVGLKPTYGRVSRHNVAPRSWSLDHAGPLCRTARDCARLLSIIAGHDPNDATSSHAAVPDYEATLEQPVAGLRIGIAMAALHGLDADVEAGLDSSRRELEKLGLQFVDVALPELQKLYEAADIIIRCEAASLHRQWIESRPQDYANQVRMRIESGFLIPATQYIDALRLRAVYAREFIERTMAGIDLLHMPSLPILPPTIAESDVERMAGAELLASLGRFSRYARPFNLLGLPAISVPCGFGTSHLPLAFQLAARPFEEALLLRVAHAYQRSTDYHTVAPA